MSHGAGKPRAQRFGSTICRQQETRTVGGALESSDFRIDDVRSAEIFFFYSTAIMYMFELSQTNVSHTVGKPRARPFGSRTFREEILRIDAVATRTPPTSTSKTAIFVTLDRYPRYARWAIKHRRIRTRTSAHHFSDSGGTPIGWRLAVVIRHRSVSGRAPVEVGYTF